MLRSVVLALAMVSGVQADERCAAAYLRPELEQRLEMDQAARRALARSRSEADLKAALAVDADNRAWLRGLLEACDWPARSQVGDKAAVGAWLIAQHADMEPDLQAIAAAKMKPAVLAGEASGHRLASLVDRHRRRQGLPQVYGMQFDRKADGRIVFLPIEAPEDLAARRREIGIEPFVCRIDSLTRRLQRPAEWPAGVPYEPADCRRRE